MQQILDKQKSLWPLIGMTYLTPLTLILALLDPVFI